MPFKKLELSDQILKALQKKGYEKPTPIQAEAIPAILQGSDIFGCAQTGTGKTAAFALPIIHMLSTTGLESSIPHEPKPKKGKGKGKKNYPKRKIRALILTPTRELAAQVAENIETYGRFTKLKYAVIYGGVKQATQVQKLNRGVDILVATPGRLFDLIDQKLLSIKDVEIFVLDEADRMLDMGFLPDIKKVVGFLPEEKQTLFFSATLPKPIEELAQSLLKDPVSITTAPQRSSAAETVDQYLYHIEGNRKARLLRELLEDQEITRAIVFVRTKLSADRVANKLYKDAGIRAEAFHSNKTQAARVKIMRGFKNGRTRALIATDIAARGIDVDDISHVINYDLPDEEENYIHRIGRTGRAGASGIAISFCNKKQKPNLKSIQKLLGKKIPVLEHNIPPMSTSERHAERRSEDTSIGKKQKQNRKKSTEDAWAEYDKPSKKNSDKRNSDKKNSDKKNSNKPTKEKAVKKPSPKKPAPDNEKLFVADFDKMDADKKNLKQSQKKSSKRKPRSKNFSEKSEKGERSKRSERKKTSGKKRSFGGKGKSAGGKKSGPPKKGGGKNFKSKTAAKSDERPRKAVVKKGKPGKKK